jgi:hypothetical protein
LWHLLQGCRGSSFLAQCVCVEWICRTCHGECVENPRVSNVARDGSRVGAAVSHTVYVDQATVTDSIQMQMVSPWLRKVSTMSAESIRLGSGLAPEWVTWHTIFGNPGKRQHLPAHSVHCFFKPGILARSRPKGVPPEHNQKSARHGKSGSS